MPHRTIRSHRLPASSGAREKGYILIWAAVTIAGLAWISARTMSALAVAAEADNTQSADLRLGAAMGAVRAAITYRLASPSDEIETLPASGAETFDGIEVQWQLARESERLDINKAEPVQIAQLLELAGFDPDRAAMLADRIADWRDEDDLKHLNGAERGEYLAAGLAPPANRDFVTPLEIAKVLGVGADLAACLEPTLSVYGGTSYVRARPTEKAPPAPPQAGDVLRLSMQTVGPDQSRRNETRLIRLVGNAGQPIWTLEVSHSAPPTNSTAELRCQPPRQP